MVIYVNIHEPDPAARQQLIDCYRSMWNVNQSKEFSNNAIVANNGSKKADIKAFPEIYRTLQFHQFDWMNNASRGYSNHLDKELYSSYTTTLMKFVAIF